MTHSQAAVAALLGGAQLSTEGTTAADNRKQQYTAVASAILQVPLLSSSDLNTTLHTTSAVSVCNTVQDDAMMCAENNDQAVADSHSIPVADAAAAADAADAAAAGAVGRGRKRAHQDCSDTATTAAAAAAGAAVAATTDATYDSSTSDAMQLETAAECDSSNSSTATAAAVAAPLLRSSPRLRTSSNSSVAQSTTTAAVAAAVTAAVTAGVRTMSLCSTPQPERRRSSRLNTATPASTATVKAFTADTTADTADDMLVSPAPS
eukprot:20843-Heterococcus_DN1.PRE.1